MLVCICGFSIFHGRSFGQSQNANDDVDLYFQKNMEHTPFLVAMISAEYDGIPEFGAGIIFGRSKDKIFIATASHVIHRGNIQPQNIQVKLKQLPGKIFKPSILKIAGEEGLDLAVLSIDDVSKQGINSCLLPFAHLATTSDLERGDGVYCLGNPNGVAWSISVDPDKMVRVEKNEIVFQSLFINKGHSGGALLDEDANIIGMTTSDEPPFGRALTIDVILKKAKAWGYPVQLAFPEDDSIALIAAVQRKDISAIKKLLSSCADPNVIDDEDGEYFTPLLHAARAGNPAITALLLSSGANPNFLSGKKESPLMLAIDEEDVETAKLLLHAGADLNVMDEDGYNPLCYAIHKNNVGLVKLLIQAKAPVNKNYNTQVAPLHLAVLNRNAELVKLLAEAGANVNEKDEDGLSLLSYATGHADITITDLLRSYGAKANASEKIENFPRIAQAIQSNNITIVQQTIATGAKAEPDMLYGPVSEGKTDMMKVLVKATNNINSLLERTGESLLHLAVASKNVDMVKLLVTNGANINAIGKTGNMPLLLAFQSDIYNHKREDTATSSAMVNYLVAHGANVSGTNLLLRKELLLRAAETHQATAAKYLLQAGTSPNIKSGNQGQNTPLQFAIKSGDAEIARALLKAGANVNEASSDNLPVIIAIKKKNLEMVKLLIEAGADVNDRGRMSSTIPLEEAIETGNMDFVNALLAAKTSKENLDKSLTTAVKSNNVEIVKAILTKDIEPANVEKLIQVALEKKNNGIADALIKVNSHPKNIDELFEKAVRGNNADFVKLFIAKGAKPATLWPTVIKEGRLSIIEIFLKSGLNVNEELDNGEYPMHLAVDNNQLEVVKLFLNSGARIDLKGNGFNSCFENAVDGGNIEIVKLLLSKGANVNEKNKEGNVPLHVAVESGTASPEMVKLLIAMKANVNAKGEYKRTPLHFAVSNGKVEIVRVLLKASADINARDDFGDYPIHYIRSAETKEADEVIDVLIKAGADVNAKNNEGETPLKEAIKNENDRVAKYLRAHGAK